MTPITLTLARAHCVLHKGGGLFEFQTPTGCETFGGLEGRGGGKVGQVDLDLGLDTCRDLWRPLGTFRDLSGAMGIYGGLQGAMVTYGDQWRPTGTHGDLQGPINNRDP